MKKLFILICAGRINPMHDSGLRFRYIASLLLTLCLAFVPESKDPTVIRVGNIRIGYREFEERLNDIPLPNENYYSPLAVKEDLATTLVAEAILASEAKKDHLDTLPAVAEMSREFFREALYEEWMQKQVMDSIKVSPAEIQVGYDRFLQIRYIDYWILPDLQQALAARRDIIEGIIKDTTGTLKKLEYGEALTGVEDTIFNMEPGQVTRPFRIDNVYYVFKLVKVEKNPLYAKYKKYGVGFFRPTIIGRIKDKESTYRLSGILRGLMAKKSYDIELNAYHYLLRRLAPIVFDKKVPNHDLGKTIQQLMLERRLKPDTMNSKPLLVFRDSGAAWTVGDIWRMLSVCPYPLNYPDRKSLESGVLKVIDQMVIFNSISGDAISKGYSNSEYVKAQTAMWSNSRLAEALLQEFRSSLHIKESTVRAFYDSTKYRHLRPELRKVIPIVVKEKSLAERLYRDITRGGDFLELARRYSQNKLGVEGKRIGIYVGQGDLGNAGKAAFRLKIGQVSPPEEMRNPDSSTSYVIVKLIGIRKPSPYPYNEIKDRLYSAYQDWMLHEYVDRFLLDVVKSYKIVINKSLLASVPYAGGNMVVMKDHFPLRTGAPRIMFFDPSVRSTAVLRPEVREMNSPALEKYYRYAQKKWFPVHRH